MKPVPRERYRSLNQNLVNAEGKFVLYWMTSNRRMNFNFSLERAIEWCRELNKPLMILDALRCDYSWASIRIHSFIIAGMNDNMLAAQKLPVTYFPYVEPNPGAGSGLIGSLSALSCVVVTDDFPCFFLPRMQMAVARRIPVLMESVDSNGLLPMRVADQVFPTAYAFRRFLQKNLSQHLSQFPQESPLAGSALPELQAIPEAVIQQWPAADQRTLGSPASLLKALPICQMVEEGIQSGGAVPARNRLNRFVLHQLPRYGEERNHPDNDAASGLSAYLHFGHISAHEVFLTIAAREKWSTNNLGDVRQTRGSRNGWWGMSDESESFLDELITWRELGYNMCWQTADYDQYESLPDWAKKTLSDHSSDPRPFVYSTDEFGEARTHDDVWNAAQTQLVREGRMHNYLRMLWGKKILEWSESPQDALKTMIELNNRYALDGRNPNSYSGIFWVLGRYDRAWGPERPIFGKIRYMTSDSTVKKLKMSGYLRQYSAADSANRLF